MATTKNSGGSRRGRRGAAQSRLADALRRAVDDVDDDDEPSVEPAAVEDDTDEPTPSRSDAAAYRIGEVAQLVGVDAHVLRYWESEFRLKPERSASGQRVYR